MIITYNQKHLITETIESVLSQDYDNLEIVVADDASTDGTQEVILDFQRKYPDAVLPVLNKKTWVLQAIRTRRSLHALGI